MPQTQINREHKDRLFRLLFGGSYSRQNLLDLYNALNDTNYNEPEELQVKLPVPQYVVFYNGSGQHEDEEILRLSDAFKRKEDGRGYEWTARMLNINYGKNKKLMERCKALRDYSIFTDKVKKYLKQEMNTEQAINRAVEECIKEDVMAEFLIAHRAEVVDVCITEYNEERVMSSIREEGIREGIEETFISLAIEGIFTDEVAADKSGLSLAEFQKKKEEYLRRKS